MKIILHQTDRVSHFSEYFDFNQIKYQIKDLWTIVDEDSHDQQFILPVQCNQTLTVVDPATFIDILSCDVSYSCLLKYLNNKNILWVGQTNDLTTSLEKIMHRIKEIDKLIPKKSILLWLDAVPVDPLIFKNVVYEIYPYVFVTVPRIDNTICTKNKDSNDFFVTSVLKERAMHRTVLSNKIDKRPKIQKNSLIHFHNGSYSLENYIGQKPQHSFPQGHPSMDLYTNSFIEIVPETLFEGHHFYTEKTNKPIATKTPFLVVTTPGYLQFLKSLGFKTFDSLIDESYDNEVNLELRIEKMLNTLENIIDNGVYEFYHSSKPILEHNFNKLCELSSKKQSIFDHLVFKQLQLSRKLLI